MVEGCATKAALLFCDVSVPTCSFGPFESLTGLGFAEEEARSKAWALPEAVPEAPLGRRWMEEVPVPSAHNLPPQPPPSGPGYAPVSPPASFSTQTASVRNK